MFLYYKYVQWRAKHGQLFCSVLLFKVLRGVSFFIVIRILLLKNIIKGVASAKYFPFGFSCHGPVFPAGCWYGLDASPLVRQEAFCLFWTKQAFTRGDYFVSGSVICWQTLILFCSPYKDFFPFYNRLCEICLNPCRRWGCCVYKTNRERGSKNWSVECFYLKVLKL